MRLTVIRHEIVVGWFIMAALVLGAVTLLLQTKHVLSTSHTLKFTIDHGQGLQPGSHVLVQGIQVGEINEIRLTAENRVEVTCLIGADYAEHIRADAVAVIQQPPLLGATTVEIQPGSMDQPAAASGQTLRTFSPKPFLEKVTEIEGRVNEVIARVDSFVLAAVGTLDEFRRLVDRIDSSEGLAGQMIHDPRLAAVAREALARVNALAARIEQEGVPKAIATLESTEALAVELRREDGELMSLLQEVRATVGEVREALAAAEVARTATALRETAAEMQQAAALLGPTTDDTRRALAALRDASRAMQHLSEELSRQPNSVIFGRSAAPDPEVRR